MAGGLIVVDLAETRTIRYSDARREMSHLKKWTHRQARENTHTGLVLGNAMLSRRREAIAMANP